MKIENVDIRINDIDHIWYNNKQYISLNRVNQMLRDKRTQTHSCNCDKKETHGNVISRADAIDAVKRHYRAHDNDLLEVVVYGLEQLPSAKPIHSKPTDEEIQKMQELEQAEIEKAYELGRQEAESEIIRCKDCLNWIPGSITDQDDFIPPKCGKYQQMVGHISDDYCSYAERRTDE